MVERHFRSFQHHARRSGKILGRPQKHHGNKIIELRNLGRPYREIVDELQVITGVLILRFMRTLNGRFECENHQLFLHHDAIQKLQW